MKSHLILSSAEQRVPRAPPPQDGVRMREERRATAAAAGATKNAVGSSRRSSTDSSSEDGFNLINVRELGYCNSINRIRQETKVTI